MSRRCSQLLLQQLLFVRLLLMLLLDGCHGRLLRLRLSFWSAQRGQEVQLPL